MDTLTLALVTSGLLLYSLVSGRLHSTIITGPLLFIILGFGLGGGGSGLAAIDLENGVIHFVAEFTLILVLFSDAARIKLADVRRDHNLPQRMLLAGLPLTILSGALIAVWMFPALSLWEAALVAALLAPTDAALGQTVVTAEAVPVRIRQAINIESGLNDGIALPAVLLFASLAASSHGGQDSPGTWIQFIVLQLALGPVIGILMGTAGAMGLDRASEKGWLSEDFLGVGVLALAFLIYVTAELVGGNGFIAVFFGGMLFGNRLRQSSTFLFRFMETEGQLLMLITFLIVGAVMLPQALAIAGPQHFVYALASLTVIRLLPVIVALLGTGLSLPTQLFLGWFGPRGLASVLFLLLILEDMALAAGDEIFCITVLTVAISAVLHGISAAPLARIYGRYARGMGSCEENKPAVEIPFRHCRNSVKKLS